MITKTIQLYTIDELSPKARERALNDWRECDNLPFLSDTIEDQIREDLKKEGVEILKNFKAHYSLSWCQGDGVMFEGVFRWKRYIVSVKHAGHYYHENSKEITMETEDGESVPEKVEEEFNDLYVDVCKAAAKAGYSEIEYQQADATIIECMNVNKITFREDGRIENK